MFSRETKIPGSTSGGRISEKKWFDFKSKQRKFSMEYNVFKTTHHPVVFAAEIFLKFKK